MKTEPIRPAQIDFTADGVPWAPQFGDVYHTAAGALDQARHVFLAGNGLPARWQGREHFTVLETGFGLGNNFLATWGAWREDPRRSERLFFISVEKHPPARSDLQRVHTGCALPELAHQLIAAWPPLTPNLHSLSFDGGRVTLLLALGDVAQWLPHQLCASVDAFYLDGFAPAKNPEMWDPRVLKALGRLASPDATAATWSVAGSVCDGLRDAGFAVERSAGFGGKRDITVARFTPRFQRREPRGWQSAATHRREAVIVGGGLAGCAAAHALAQLGWQCRVLDRQAHPAQEASGNPGGLFHGIVNPQDGAHARFNRAAALQLRALLPHLLVHRPITGGFDGMLRLQVPSPSKDLALASMRRAIEATGLPPDYVRAVDTAEARGLSGLPLAGPAWFYPGGGWLHPGDLARSWLEDSPRVQWQGNTRVDALRRIGDNWQLLDASGAVLAQAPVVVLANANDATLLLSLRHWPVSAVRGQTTLVPSDVPGLLAPLKPVAGAGYLLPAHAGHVLCGATTLHRDSDPDVRVGDHLHNLAQVERITGSRPVVDAAQLQGRVGWRCVADDRLPVLGPVPDEAALGRSGERLDHPRFVPRRPGLYVYTGLGSRGITWSALGARVLAAWIAGTPCPVETDLRDAVDAARFVSRAARRPPG
ncbi:bifunctional tRNA (5-methylaminomethyl-2-thiouridine)(34)-methyltransferase MnmD/FAD-dependent 5-carboxymethylaminomethyl-2-thiouridine(34) oxidoreductase MnmC [Schlegelella sp. S2-27]|uniref:tRNA 5-methylaminomethyl-2-thiouridine biosynthesis bifunctional protein MnmC n=1 Tax=Caldimonas mangrovi TaxID=2944811 RepID=A0ABT0YNV3_9BURK|nr:bifunctional tRNA (5-methylaminomethyl-2-thiouridine)(34)-methyltransferase MnmD/FAD-dependent 5-carboxymethylaminomethyl-2-thiouridine(34) oxidoreductase MnmC [Caldimonas mangrovi]MCM5680406.1 bifunctional tRNA (5-methylaminomethyl-2-thiouridine)(34)-methyltransferase MnmD/FAD-dependent 5-carboxymethylaminomethyl-2-thiouridine(34) oxidoreductase MnmC [Caldimonas mangrovi]